jgi:hypothetical protein
LQQQQPWQQQTNVRVTIGLRSEPPLHARE